jgi:hypothetical protein
LVKSYKNNGLAFWGCLKMLERLKHVAIAVIEAKGTASAGGRYQDVVTAQGRKADPSLRSG